MDTKLVERPEPNYPPQTNGAPLLPLLDSEHGGGTTLTALIEQDVDELSFDCWALDVAPPTPCEVSHATSEDAQ